MMLVQAPPQFVFNDVERRQYQRVRVELLGRYMNYRDRLEYPCRTLNMSPGGVEIETEHNLLFGEKVLAYIDQIGRVEGVVSRILSNGFSITFDASEKKREKIAEQLLWIANRANMGISEDRGNVRVVPTSPFATISLHEGHKVPCKVENISLTGAAIDINIKPALGDVVALNGQIAKVIRVTDKGCALEFPPNSAQSIYSLAHNLGAVI